MGTFFGRPALKARPDVNVYMQAADFVGNEEDLANLTAILNRELPLVANSW